MQTIDFSPFYRSTVGFDRVFNRLDTLVGQEAKTYPPYNIERTGDDAYRISIAVAGFANGDIAIETRTTGRGRNAKTGLWLAFSRTPALKGPLEPYDGETMRTRFTDKREEDLLITFALGADGKAIATMKALSPDADFSYDYQDLRLTRV